MLTYKANGMVLGKLWGGGIGGYPAEILTADNLTELDKQIERGIEDGSLDGGMGFESLIGAMMSIETIDSRTIDGKKFIASEIEIKVYGYITEKQEEMLLETF